MNKIRRITVATLTTLALVPVTAACNLPTGTCDAISMSATAGGKGGGGGRSGSKAGKSKTGGGSKVTKPKTGSGVDYDDDCDDD